MNSTVVHGDVISPARDFGDLRGEFGAIVSASGLYNLSSRIKFALTGGDRMRWLNGMITNNIRDLAPGHGVYAFLLNPQGHILGDLYAFNRGDSLLIDSDQAHSQKLLATFDHYIIMDDVEITNLSDKLTAIGIAGPKSEEVLRTAGFELPNLAPLEFSDRTWRDTAVTVVRSDNETIESYELWLLPDQVPLLWNALSTAGAKPAGTAALELIRVASGIPRYGTDIRERDLPQETEQSRALHFSKGCYIGQEIVERIRSRGNVHRKFIGFEVQGALPAPGTKLEADGRNIGEITSVASLPSSSGDWSVALGYIRRELATPGKQILVGSIQLSVAPLPFAKFFDATTLKN